MRSSPKTPKNVTKIGREPHTSPSQNQQQCDWKRGNGLGYSIILGSQTPHPFSCPGRTGSGTDNSRGIYAEVSAIADTGAQYELWSLTDFLAYNFSCDKLHPESLSLSVGKHSHTSIEGAFYANLVTKSDCGNVTSCHYMVYVEALSRICSCLTTRHSALDFCCGSNGTAPDRESLNQQPHTSPEMNTTERIINIINIIERMPVWKTRYLVSSQESTKAPLPHSRYLTTGKSSVKFCRITKDTWKTETDSWDGYHSVPLRHHAICLLKRRPSTSKLLVIGGKTQSPL